VPAGDPCLTEGGCGTKYDCWDHGSAVIATTTSTSNRFTGQIEDADIELNDAPGPDGNRFIFSTVDSPLCARANQVGCVNIDIRNTVTHEAGHSIGLAHTPIADATMFATAPPGELTKRTVHADDIAAICAIYPKGAPTSTCLTDPISITVAGAGEVKGCGCSATAGAAPALQGLGLAAVALLLRRKRMNRAPARRTTV
jgi:MYXO-CTERM domain-containing protein